MDQPREHPSSTPCETDQPRETAVLNPRQDLHDASTEQQDELSAHMSQAMGPVPPGYRSRYATSSFRGSPLRQNWPSQEMNDVEIAASHLSINGHSHSTSADLLSYPSRLLDIRATAIRSSSAENVQRSLLTSTTIPANPSSDYLGTSEQLDRIIIMRTEGVADVEDGQEHVEDRRKHADTSSDGVYLQSVDSSSFIGVSLSSLSPPHVRDASNPGEVIVISDDADSEDDTSMPRQTLQALGQPHNVNSIPFWGTHNMRAGQDQNSPITASTIPQQPPGFRALNALGPAVENQGASPGTSLRHSSVQRFSNLMEDRTKTKVADFDVVVTTRESSTTVESARSSADREPQAGSAAAKIDGIFQDLLAESTTADVQRVEWEKWAENQRGKKRSGNVWRTDLLLRNVKRQIQAKLQGRYPGCVCTILC